MPKWVPIVVIVVAVLAVAVAGWKMMGKSGPPSVDKDVQVRPNMYNLQDEMRKGNVGVRRMPPTAPAPN